MRIRLPSSGPLWGHLFGLSVLLPPLLAGFSGDRSVAALTAKVYEGLGNGLALSMVFLLCAVLGRWRGRRDPAIHLLSTGAWFVAWVLVSLLLGEDIRAQLETADVINASVSESQAFPGVRAGPFGAVFILILFVSYTVFGFSSAIIGEGLLWESLWCLFLLGGFILIFLLVGGALVVGVRRYYWAYTDRFDGPNVLPPPPPPEDRHLRIVARINLVVGATTLSVRALGFAGTVLFGESIEDPSAPWAGALVVGLVGAVYFFTSIGATLDLLVGWSIFRNKSWSRPLGIVMGGIAVLQAPAFLLFLFNFSWIFSPVWAALGGYQIWALTRTVPSAPRRGHGPAGPVNPHMSAPGSGACSASSSLESVSRTVSQSLTAAAKT